MADIGDSLLQYRATRDCPSCKRGTNSEITITDNWVRVLCKECTLIRDVPRLPGVVREPV
jgi:hypothetical protein